MRRRRGMLSTIWGQLTPGDEIVIDAGAGDPKRASAHTAIVYHVWGMSALMTDGTRICCSDTCRLKLTGNRDEEWEGKITPEAKRFFDAAPVRVALRAMEDGGAFN